MRVRIRFGGSMVAIVSALLVSLPTGAATLSARAVISRRVLSRSGNAPTALTRRLMSPSRGSTHGPCGSVAGELWGMYHPHEPLCRAKELALTIAPQDLLATLADIYDVDLPRVEPLIAMLEAQFRSKPGAG